MSERLCGAVPVRSEFMMNNLSQRVRDYPSVRCVLLETLKKVGQVTKVYSIDSVHFLLKEKDQVWIQDMLEYNMAFSYAKQNK